MTSQPPTHRARRLPGALRGRVGDAPCLEPASDAGFVVDEADVTFWGICPDCQSERLEERL